MNFQHYLPQQIVMMTFKLLIVLIIAVIGQAEKNLSNPYCSLMCYNSHGVWEHTACALEVSFKFVQKKTQH